MNTTTRTGGHGPRLSSRTPRRRARLLAAALAAIAGLTCGLYAQTTRPASRAASTAAATGRSPNRIAAADQFQRAKDSFSKSNYQQAYVENEKALLLDPSLPDAILLRRILQDKLRAASETPNTPTGTAQTAAGKIRTLTPQQISIIRLMETDPDQMRTLRGSVPRKTLEEVWENVVKRDRSLTLTRADYDSFLNPQNFPRQAVVIRDSNDPKYLEQITVTSDPPTMAQFRREVHPYVLQTCATSDCHGGDKSGDFRLIGGGNNDQTMYTNFYIMTMYHGRIDGHEVRMIDRGNPANSLFLQYSLPKSLALYPHPGNVEPRRIPGTNDNRFRNMTNWVQSLVRLQPNYGITYELPTTAPATRAK